MNSETILAICMFLFDISVFIVAICIAISVLKEIIAVKSAYNKGYDTAKNLYFNHWRKEFETARLKLIDVDDKFRDHYVTIYLKRRDYE